MHAIFNWPEEGGRQRSFIQHVQKDEGCCKAETGPPRLYAGTGYPPEKRSDRRKIETSLAPLAP